MAECFVELSKFFHNFGLIFNLMHTAPYNIYTDQSCFDRELVGCSPKSGFFAAHGQKSKKLAPLLLEHLRLAKLLSPVTGATSRFFNKCLHRGHRLTELKRGLTETFTCPYHGWQYDGSGSLIRILREQKFYGTNANEFVSVSGVESLHVTRLGDFIFINCSSQPQAVETQFDQAVIEGLN